MFNKNLYLFIKLATGVIITSFPIVISDSKAIAQDLCSYLSPDTTYRGMNGSFILGTYHCNFYGADGKNHDVLGRFSDATLVTEQEDKLTWNIILYVSDRNAQNNCSTEMRGILFFNPSNLNDLYVNFTDIKNPCNLLMDFVYSVHLKKTSPSY